MSRPADAMPYIERALQNAERFAVATKGDPHLMQHLINRGTATAALGDVQRGMRDIERAIAVAEEAREESERALLYLFNTAGWFARRNGDQQAAIRYFERAIRTQFQEGSSPWPIVVMPMINLALTLHETGNRKAARRTIEQANQLAQAAYAPMHPLAIKCGEIFSHINGKKKR